MMAKVPTESTWPQTEESKITPGLNMKSAEAARPTCSAVLSPRRPRKRRANRKRSQAVPASARIPGILTRPLVTSSPTSGCRARPTSPSAHSTYM